jgi:hypothetical protein
MASLSCKAFQQRHPNRAKRFQIFREQMAEGWTLALLSARHTQLCILMQPRDWIDLGNREVSRSALRAAHDVRS